MLDTSNIVDVVKLEHIVNQLRSIIDQAWSDNAKKLKISKHSKQWWSDACSWSLNNYRTTRSCENWKTFKKTVKDAKRTFFDNKIQEIANKSRSPWELMNWVKNRKLPATEAIKHDGRPCLTPDSLLNSLYSFFNTALHCQVDPNILNEVKRKPSQWWSPFSRTEFKSTISKCSDSSASGPDKLMAPFENHHQRWRLSIQHHQHRQFIHQLRALAILFQDLDHYRHSQTQQVIVWSSESISPDSSSQYPR